MIYQLQNLDKHSSLLLPDGCRRCGWWQGHDKCWPDGAAADSWMEAAAAVNGGWGKLALADEELLGSIQFGPPELFPRARSLSFAPISQGAVLLACGHAGPGSLSPVLGSLVTAMLAEMRQGGVETVEAFSMERPPEAAGCRFFPFDFLQGCGFYPVRNAGEIRLMRLKLSGAQPSRRWKHPRRGLLERMKRRRAVPAPVALTVSVRRQPCRP